ncbi:ArsR/SmtB family transcription factor [Marinitoga lauensis]|uniref:ArsR/SmtB family transcription factor n=1 Tax=Marinitoga lauensis TaxID=2201189 RepID=UPI0023EA54AC|nr:metalloregulator ArsR/SmtB family transcription factor [Marinitoga lauensis]
MFALLGSPIRIKILSLLSERPYCVNHISKSLNISQPLASQHLKLLKENGFVVCERDAQKIRYKISSEEVKKFLNKLISETKNLEVIR